MTNHIRLRRQQRRAAPYPHHFHISLRAFLTSFKSVRPFKNHPEVPEKGFGTEFDPQTPHRTALPPTPTSSTSLPHHTLSDRSLPQSTTVAKTLRPLPHPIALNHSRASPSPSHQHPTRIQQPLMGSFQPRHNTVTSQSDIASSHRDTTPYPAPGPSAPPLESETSDSPLLGQI
jgi:hypothetical protein